MTVKSLFNQDLKQEQILGEYLDRTFYDKYFTNKYKRNNNINLQYEGVDIVLLDKYNRRLIIDEKAQITRFNNPTPTFAFELSFEKNGTRQDGWLYKDNKTEYFMLYYFNKVDVSKSKILADGNQIKEMDFLLVSKAKLHNYLISRGLTRETIENYANELLHCDENKRYLIDGERSMSVYCTRWLAEKPLNLVISRRVLEQFADLAITVAFNGESSQIIDNKLKRRS